MQYTTRDVSSLRVDGPVAGCTGPGCTASGHGHGGGPVRPGPVPTGPEGRLTFEVDGKPRKLVSFAQFSSLLPH